MKKLIALLLVIAMVACLFAGCGGNNTTTEPPADDAQTDAPADGGDDATASGPDYSSIKIGVLLNTPRNDGGWCQTVAESMDRCAAQYGIPSDNIIIAESVEEGGTVADDTIAQMIAAGCNLIVGASSSFINNIGNAAEANPDVYFAQFEGNKDLPNYVSYTIWDIEAIFMCGYAGALMSDTSEFGFVAAQPQASVIRAVNAWAAGARAAKEDATVQVVWTNSWYDPVVEKENATGLLQNGIKVLGYHGSTDSVITAAHEAGGYCTGFHLDMRNTNDVAPETVLTSLCWNWDPIFGQIITDIAEGNFKGGLIYKNMAEGAAQVAPWNTNIMPEDVVAQCEDMYNKIVAGEYEVMAGPIYDNKGNEILADGASFTLEELVEMHFLLDNVIGDLS